MFLQDYLPITVVCAIAIFLIKEVIEFFKKRAEKRRKIKAYQSLVMDEVKKNAWSVKHLKNILNDLSDPGFNSVKIKNLSSGSSRIFVDVDGRVTSSPIWPLHTSVFEKLYIGLAEADETTFTAVSEVYEELAEARHVKDSLVEHIVDPRHLGELQGFVEYAGEVLIRCESAMNKFSINTTGEDLKNHKLRSYI